MHLPVNVKPIIDSATQSFNLIGVNCKVSSSHEWQKPAIASVYLLEKAPIQNSGYQNFIRIILSTETIFHESQLTFMF